MLLSSLRLVKHPNGAFIQFSRRINNRVSLSSPSFLVIIGITTAQLCLIYLVSTCGYLLLNIPAFSFNLLCC